jgi:hypothetical protein
MCEKNPKKNVAPPGRGTPDPTSRRVDPRTGRRANIRVTNPCRHTTTVAKPDFETGTTNQPPGDAKPAVPPYEGRKETADVGDDSAEEVGARTGGATEPTTDKG